MGLRELELAYSAVAEGEGIRAYTIEVDNSWVACEDPADTIRIAGRQSEL